jgi:signal transduction histidine kinase
MAGVLALGVVGNLALGITMPPEVPAFDATSGSLFAYLLPFGATAAIAVLLALKRPGNPVGWLLGLLIFAFFLGGISQDYLFHWLYVPDLPPGGVVPLALVSSAVSSVIPSALILLTLVFPDGHLLSRRWRPVVWLTVAYTVMGATSLLDPTVIGDGHRVVANPVALPGGHDLLATLNNAGLYIFVALMALSLASLGLRYRGATSDLRHQVKWFLAGSVVVVLGIVVASATSESSTWATPAPIIASTIGFSALPIALGIAVLRFRLYDIDVVISRALVYGALALMITAVYVAIVVGIGTTIGAGNGSSLVLSIVATAIVAVAFQPVRERLQKVANRLVYGKRATPYELLSELSERVAESMAAEDVLPRMAEALRAGTGAEGATVWMRSGGELRPMATAPDDFVGYEPLPLPGSGLPAFPGEPAAAAVSHQDQLLGALTVSKRRGESLTPLEAKLVGDLAAQAGLVLENVGLTAQLLARLEDLRASRQRVVAAQDEERRRLERNLHDGAQQNLVALKVKLGLAEAFADKDPAKTRELLGQVKADTDEALETLRDLARGIYPPLLADRGLVAAIEGQARKATVPVSVDAEGVGRYPQEVEAAVYFCVLEALQNVQKYAGAASATVRLRLAGDELHFEVEDDGAGFDAATVERGAGLTNMADRIDALGGTLVIASTPGRGSRVEGSLPLGVTVPA